MSKRSHVMWLNQSVLISKKGNHAMQDRCVGAAALYCIKNVSILAPRTKVKVNRYTQGYALSCQLVKFC